MEFFEKEQELVLFTMPMCHDCKRAKARIGADLEETVQHIQKGGKGVTCYLLPKDGMPSTLDHVMALSALDYFVTGEVTVPALVVKEEGNRVVYDFEEIKKILNDVIEGVA